EGSTFGAGTTCTCEVTGAVIHADTPLGRAGGDHVHAVRDNWVVDGVESAPNRREACRCGRRKIRRSTLLCIRRREHVVWNPRVRHSNTTGRAVCGEHLVPRLVKDPKVLLTY